MPIIHIIHCPDRTDRYNLLMLEVAEQGFEYQLWECVKGGKSGENISQAHKKIVQFAKDNTLESIVIAEDDVHFVAPKAWDYYLSKTPTDYDLYLSSIMWGRILPDNTTSDFAGLQLFTIHNRYYDKFLESDPKRDIDRAQMRRGVFKVCVPFATIQHETVSDNKRRVIHNNRKLYFDKVLWNGTNG